VTGWSEGPFARVERLTDLRLGKSISENNGQCRRVCVVDSHPGWLFKEYHSNASDADVLRLDKLTERPVTLRPADRELVDRNMSWPVSRVTRDSHTVGVLMPAAPDTFTTNLRTVNGRTRNAQLPIDLLAIDDDRMNRLGLPHLSLIDRVTVCSSIASVAALFERAGLVYLDWSYANAFWSTSELAAYVIDVDGCSFGPRLQMETNDWADPLVPRHSMASNAVDRYRVALLVARCLTAERDRGTVLAAVENLARCAPMIRGVAEHVVHVLTASTAAARPPLVELAAALTYAVTGAPEPGEPRTIRSGPGIKGWTPVKPRPGHPQTRPILHQYPTAPTPSMSTPGPPPGVTVPTAVTLPTPTPDTGAAHTAAVLAGWLLLAGLLFLIFTVLA